MQSSSNQQAEATYSRAAKAELAKDYDAAFGLYIKAAEGFLHLRRSCPDDDKESLKWKNKASAALQRAEKIKAFSERSKPNKSALGHPGSPEVRLTPVAIDRFSLEEQSYVLKKSGSVNGIIFPIWDTASSSSTYEQLDQQPSLSPEQLKVSPVWRHPNDGVGTQQPEREIVPQDILQHIVTDCSVCTALSVCLEHSRRFNSNLAKSVIRNVDAQGNYHLKLFFNGDWRRVTIDDQLPYHPTLGSLVCMSCAPSPNSPPVIWPSLVEKGYIKLMGGYDFPGSNSSIDLHTLVGWIPEQIDIKSPTFEREKSWTRIFEGFLSGQCMLTLGTGARSDIRWRNTQLLASHSYAVIDVVENDEEGRILTVLDSWVRPPSTEVASNDASRILKMSWSDVLDVFDGLYLSWDPTLWEKCLTIHGIWKTREQENSCTEHTVIKFDGPRRDSESELWILLTRHVVDTRRSSDFISLKVQMEDDLKFGSHTRQSSFNTIQGTYTNSPHVLVRARIPPSQSSGTLSIFASFDGRSKDVGYTLIAYASAKINIAWDTNVAKPPFTTQVEGKLTSKNAGGNSSNPSFMVNPQYHLRVHPPKQSSGSISKAKAAVGITMQAAKDIPVNVAVIWSQGERIFELSHKQIATSSGAYSYGLATVQDNLPVGDYTIILSAFEPHHFGPFTLKFDSSLPFDLVSIPSEGAGMYTKTILGTWDSQTAAGSPSFNRYSQNPIIELDIPSPTQIKIRLQLLHPASTSLNVTVYPASSSPDGNPSLTRHLATSGGYDDAISGVATPLFAVKKGRYWIVPSTYEVGEEGSWRVIVYSGVGGVEAQLMTRS